MIKKMSENMTNWIVKDLDISSKQVSAIRYGLESVFGTLIETAAVFLFAYFMGILPYAVFLMIPPFFYRMLADGPHCTSYKRCFVFTLVVYLVFSLIAKYAYVFSNLSFLLILIFSSVISLILSYSNKLINNISATVLYFLFVSTISLLLWVFNLHRELVFTGTLGLSLQAFISTPMGYKTVKLFDNILKYLKIN